MPELSKEAANLWWQEQMDEKRAKESRHKARYLVSYLREVGDTKSVEAEDKLAEIRKLAEELHDILDDSGDETT